MEAHCHPTDSSGINRRLEFEDVNKEHNDLFIEEVVHTEDQLLQNQNEHENISEEVPTLGMEFHTEEEAFEFYRAYAKKTGFGIRMSSGHKDYKGKMIDRTFCCSAEGKRRNDKRDVNVRCHRRETRFDCKAMMQVNCRETGIYRVVQLVVEHTHDLCSPRKTHLFRSHRQLSAPQAAEADMARSAGITPKATMELMARQVGGRDNLGFIPVDYKNYVRSKRTREMKLGDTGGVLEYLQKRQFEDPNFFYAIQVDEDDLITNIFWADARMMVDFAYFGDVVCFDTTYRSNNDGRPFALFVGVNHHKQTVTFGAALLYDETSSTFEWLFSTFSRAMSGLKPKTILTDQCQAMAVALKSQWPETYHRLCIWHIYQNAAIHLSSIFANFKDFAKDFSRCVYDYDEEDEFIDAWKNMLEKYGLEQNGWLKRMFEIKEKWALVYGRETFCADMTSTQRSESMNSVLKKYVSYKNNMLEFFHHFDRLLADRRYEEFKADFRATQSAPALPLSIDILKHAAKVYTYDVFRTFQAECSKAYDSNFHIIGEEGKITKYTVTHPKKHNHHIVTCDSEQGTILCSCRKFEFVGILCSHALRVLSLNGILQVPDKYILPRWTKRAKDRSKTLFKDIDLPADPKAKVAVYYKDLCKLYVELVAKAAQTEETYKLAKNGFQKLFEEVNDCIKHIKLDKNTETSCTEAREVITNNLTSNKLIVSGVKGIKNKEKPVKISGKRLLSGLERATRKQKRKRQGKSSKIEESGAQQSEYDVQDTEFLNCQNNIMQSGTNRLLPQPIVHVPEIWNENNGSQRSTLSCPLVSNDVDGSMMKLLQEQMFRSTGAHQEQNNGGIL